MIATAIAPELVHGAPTHQHEATPRGLRLHRLPLATRTRDADPQLALVEAQPSGMRVVVETDASTIALVLHATRVAFRGLARPRGSVDVVVDGLHHATIPLADGDLVEVDPTDGSRSLAAGGPDRIVVTLPQRAPRRIELWLPHDEQVELVHLESDASLTAVPVEGTVWLHHGSSISQGSNAATPTGIWPVVAARRAGVHLRNLGVGGSALADPFMARVIRDSPADLISVKLGINVVNLDAMRLRSLVPAIHGFLDTIREGHPSTPLLLISPLHCGIHESTPGPGAIDPASLASGSARFIATGSPADVVGGRLTLRVIREALATIVHDRSDDANLSFLDGLELFGVDDEERHPLPDGLHPGPSAHDLIGARFADLVLSAGGAFDRHDRRPIGAADSGGVP